MEIERRRYQDSAVRRLLALRRGARLLLVGPTGSGKTAIAARAIRRWIRDGKRVAFVAHEHAIVDQTYQTLIALGLPESRVGVLMASDERITGHRERVRSDAPVQVCSIQTLTRRDAQPRADILIIDEAHHSAAESYGKLIALYPRATILGMTATPYRMDGKGLDDVFAELFEIEKPSALIEAGHLAKPIVYSAPKGMIEAKLKGVRVVAGDYQRSVLGERMNTRTLVGNLIKEYRRLGRGQKFVGFGANVEHARACAARFVREGIPCEFMDESTSPNERQRILDALREGRLQGIWSFGLFGEGWHEPCVKCVIEARPTRSQVVYMQQCGRILSPYKGQRPIILDHAGNAWRFGLLPGQDIEHALEGLGKLKGRMPVRECSECMALSPAGAAECAECGHAFPEREKTAAEIDETEAQLERLKAKELIMERVRGVAAMRGLGLRWLRAAQETIGASR